ncbi:hypothetical protein EJ065_3482 [Corallococcus coralloides]|uniref:Lipoprotein n=1 Tax=Corallococcus coralloides TaxID=184914 RepID=A0A410RSZ2_CORCK|nr:hypothetical protein [Corallococcus coralloides]QAT85043.1 hypothetical protein EJ065_3482 [Corallococcus coralloides]RYZ15480.1 MAG: hypothetical protein EOO70_06735 [Myxococcaceae bacterium]
MLTRVVKSAFVVMGLSLALACGGTEAADTEQTEGISADVQAPTMDAVSDDVSAQNKPGCGAWKQPCCELKYCNSGLECDPSTLKCLL